MANVSIPLFNLKAGSFSVPVTLSYHNNGLKNDDLASWAGLGWDIQAGGLITCEQRGNFDFDISGDGMFTTAPGTNPNSVAALNKYLSGQMSVNEAYDWMESVIRGDVDAEYDVYHYNFMGHTGNFYFDGNQNIICVPKCDLKISRTAEGGFTIFDEKGNEYDFGYAEASTLAPPDGQLASRKSFHSAASYLLGRIITSENRTFTFVGAKYPMTYSRTSYSFGVTGTQPYTECPGNSQSPSTMIYTLDNYLLQEIDYDEGKVVFDLSSDMRQDLRTINTNINIPYLTGVRLLDNQNNVHDAYSFSCDNTGNRLMLNSVTRKNGTAPSEKWSFDYYAGRGIPAYFDMKKDHWGYCNGMGIGTNVLAIPLADYFTATNGVWVSGIQSIYVDRTSDVSYSIQGVLHHITFPTGGQTEFNYEQNQINFIRPSDLTSNPFLTTDALAYGQTQTLVDVTTDDNPTVTGTFILTTDQTVDVLATKEYDPTSFVASSCYINPNANPNANPSILDLPTVDSWTLAAGVYTQHRPIFLTAGTYSYTLIRNTYDNNPGGGHATLNVSAFLPDPNIVYPLGGCRVSSIVSSDGLGKTITKRYVYQDGSDKVTFRNIPNYLTVSNVNVDVPSGDGALLCQQCNPAYIAHDESVVPFAGNPIEYQYVTEYSDADGTNGRTDYVFNADVDFTGITGAPHIPRWVTTWRGGLPLDKKVFKKRWNELRPDGGGNF